MFRAFASSGGSRTLSDNQQHRTLPGGSSDASEDEARVRHVRVAILGTGFSGLGMAIRLKQRGQEDFVVIERAADIGGTWRDNTYPGCACDIPSHLYSFSFALNPHWSRAYSPWHEIRDYLRSCAKRFGILPHIRWNCELLNASWHEDDQCWHITTTQGQITADILILGNGPLSEPSLPSVPGIEHFEGVLFHSARWNHDYDLTGKRVFSSGPQDHVATRRIAGRTSAISPCSSVRRPGFYPVKIIRSPPGSARCFASYPSPSASCAPGSTGGRR